MKNKHYTREHKHYASHLIISLVVIAVIVVSSFVTVMANTVPCTVADREETYSFSLLSPEMDDIVQKAVEGGMPPLDKDDKIAMDGKRGQVVVDRAMSVSILRGNEYTNVLAYTGDTVLSVLESGGITVADKDIVEPAPDTVIDKDMSIQVKPYTAATVTDNGVKRKAVLYGGTVADALKKLDIKLASGDKLSPTAETRLYDGIAVTVQRIKTITVKDGDKTTEHKTLAPSVHTALKDLGYTLGEEDIVTPALFTVITKGMSVEIGRRTFEEVTETEAVPHETIYRDDSAMMTGESSVETEGVDGKNEVIYRDIYMNNELDKREKKSEKVLSAPVTEVVIRGTKEPEIAAPPPSSGGGGNSGGSTFTDYNGDTIYYNNVMTGECTAYSDPGGITSLGGATQVGVVAVNPDVIPYGTRLYVTSGSVVYGYCVAGDTGGAALSGRILVDVYYDSESECESFGRRDMTVYILS